MADGPEQVERVVPHEHEHIRTGIGAPVWVFNLYSGKRIQVYYRCELTIFIILILDKIDTILFHEGKAIINNIQHTKLLYNHGQR